MILLIDKPKGWTSFDVVAKLRSILHIKKIGHAGTLDPNATGLLIIGTEADTKKLENLTKNTTKTYEAEIVLGENRTTDDIEGEVTKTFDVKEKPTEEEIVKVLKSFEGEQMQMPPIYSAIKIKGKKAYELARKGKEIKLEPRRVNIYEIKLISYDYPTLKIICEVSAGTYIRSLAKDIGEKLNTGAYLNELRRTKVGEYLVEKALPLQELPQLLQREQQQH